VRLLVALSFMWIVLVGVCFVLVTAVVELNKGIPTPTPAAEPAAWCVGSRQLAGDPGHFRLIM